MHFTTKLIVSGFLVSTSCVSIAEQRSQSFSGMYLGANVSRHQYDHSYPVDKLLGGMFKVGYDFNKIFALEGQVGATVPKSYALVNTQGQQIGDYSLQGMASGIYARVNWRLLNVTLYGLLGAGYYKTTVTISNTGFIDGTEETSKTGFSYGAGLDLFGGRHTALSLNWLQLINEDIGYGEKMRVNAIHLGITYYFKPQKTNHPVDPDDRLNNP